jgi:hypothetical protein
MIGTKVWDMKDTLQRVFYESQMAIIGLYLTRLSQYDIFKSFCVPLPAKP